MAVRKRAGLARPRDPQGRKPRSGGQRLYGVHCVREALRARRRRLDRLLVRKGPRRLELEEVVMEAEAAGVPILEVEAEELSVGFASAGNAQGVALEAGPLPEVGIEVLCAGSGRGSGLLVALDGVEDPQNVGAIARVAEGAGATGLVLTQRRAPPLSPALARASAGAIEWLETARVTNLGRALNLLKQHGFWVVGADLEDSSSLFEEGDRALTGDLVVVLGAEGRGLRPGIRQLVDHPLRIPMAGRIASLNVAAAAAVMLFEVRRRRDAVRRESDSPRDPKR